MSLLHFSMFRNSYAASSGGGSSGSYGTVVNSAGYTLTDPTIAGTYDYYVNAATGSNSNSGTSSGAAWADLSNTTLAKIPSGSKVLVKAGTYTMPATWSGSVADGTSAAVPTQIIAAPGESVTYSIPSGGSLMDGVNMWSFWGGTISCTDNGFWWGYDVATSHLGFYFMTGTQSIGASDNTGIFFCHGTQEGACDYLDVQMCTLTGSYGTGPGTGVNTSLIYCRKVKHYNIIGNLLQNCLNPIYGKHELTTPPSSSSEVSRIIRNNIIKNGGRYIEPVAYYVQFINNLVIDCPYYNGTYDGGHSGGLGDIIRNNTFFRSTSAPTLYIDLESGAVLPTGQTVKDNVFAGGYVGFCRYDNVDLIIDSNNNLFPSGSSIYTYNNSANTLSGWQGLSSQMPLSTRDTNSLSGTATFSGSSSSVTPSDWVLTGPSSALTGSTTGGAIGCNTSKLLTTDA